jgi:hypothetical protein
LGLFQKVGTFATEFWVFGFLLPRDILEFQRLRLFGLACFSARICFSNAVERGESEHLQQILTNLHIPDIFSMSFSDNDDSVPPSLPVHNPRPSDPLIELAAGSEMFILASSTLDGNDLSKSVKSWNLVVVLEGRREASKIHNLSALPEHFVMVMSPPSSKPYSFSEFVHKMHIQLKVQYDFLIRPSFYDPMFKCFVVLTQANIDYAFNLILRSIVSNTHLNDAGKLRAACTISLAVNYDAFVKLVYHLPFIDMTFI